MWGAPSNLPPGVTDRDIERAAGELNACPSCGAPVTFNNDLCDDCVDRAYEKKRDEDEELYSL